VLLTSRASLYPNPLTDLLVCRNACAGQSLSPLCPLPTQLLPQVVNDDGPPDDQLSPYILPFVRALNDAGHQTSVVLPTKSRSWIGKAHIIGDVLTATYVNPVQLSQVDDIGHPDTSLENDWIFVDGTPASCVQLGVFNLFPERPLVDLVISGPNHGRNASTIYNLSSGTVGGALEAANCGHKAVALSFTSKEKQPVRVIEAASRHSVRLIEHLYLKWPKAVELFNINIPMLEDVESRPTAYSRSLASYWSKGSLYQEVATPSPEELLVNGRTKGSRLRRFNWAPELSDIKKASATSHEGTDMWTLNQGFTR
jgi:5'/3'-nucleotidase SurE